MILSRESELAKNVGALDALSLIQYRRSRLPLELCTLDSFAYDLLAVH